jgi:hypothetical protein
MSTNVHKCLQMLVLELFTLVRSLAADVDEDKQAPVGGGWIQIKRPVAPTSSPGGGGIYTYVLCTVVHADGPGHGEPGCGRATDAGVVLHASEAWPWIRLHPTNGARAGKRE